MAEPKNKEQSLVSLKSKFEKKYGIPYGSTIGIWDRYKAKNLVYITDQKGESYWFDNRTKQRVTSSYKSRTYRELKKSNQAVTNFGKISINRLGKSYNLLDLKSQLSIAESRARFYPEAKPGDQPRKGDTPHYTYNKKGELVITGGKIQYQKNKTIRDLKAKIKQAELGISQVVPNRYNRALSIMGLGKKPTKVPKVDYKNVKVTGAPVKLDDGSFVVLDRDGKNTPILPGTAFYSAAEKAHKEGKVFQLTGGKGEPVSEQVKADNNNLPKTVNDYKGPSSPSSRRYHGTKSLNIKPNDKVVVRNPETNVEQTYTSPHPQVGRLKINPGGLVGRYDDIRLDNKGSTSLSIAQADWGSYKKGDQLGVMTRSDRRAYDKQVLNVG